MGVPARIGRFRILGQLGEGAMGAVYRGRDETLERDVAVKVMSGGLSDAAARARFLREARAAARLQHPNIIVIYELGDHDGVPFMALELLEGIDLQRAMEAGVRSDPRLVLPIVLQVLAGLAHAHEHGVVHRDVKPSNVFLPFGRPIKVTDFGVARLAGLATTGSGASAGTPNYMSPEQIRGGEIDGRSDLFSAGLILYELLAGRRCFQADVVVTVFYKILNEEPDLAPLAVLPASARLSAIVARALAKATEERYRDARAMSADLASVLTEVGASPDWTAPIDLTGLVSTATWPAPTQPAPAAAAPPPVTAARARRRARPRQTALRPPIALRASAEVSRHALVWAALMTVGAIVLAGVALWLRLAPPPLPRGPAGPSLPSPTVGTTGTPSGTEATALVEQARPAIAIETCLRDAREALANGDREKARAAVERGLALSGQDERLQKLLRELDGR